jgi:hypothetical protein
MLQGLPACLLCRLQHALPVCGLTPPAASLLPLQFAEDPQRGKELWDLAVGLTGLKETDASLRL